MTVEEFKALALSFPGTMEAPHFDRTAFKIINKRIFATLDNAGKANLRLSPADQPIYCSYGQAVVFPVPNKWGLQGWTTFDLDNLPGALLQDALENAYKYCSVKNKNF